MYFNSISPVKYDKIAIDLGVNKYWHFIASYRRKEMNPRVFYIYLSVLHVFFFSLQF